MLAGTQIQDWPKIDEKLEEPKGKTSEVCPEALERSELELQTTTTYT